MKTFFRLLLLGLVLIVVALVSALAAMQIAIHGREVSVPDFVGKTPADAGRIAEQDGLPLEVERQYYSATVAEGKIVSQVPAPGTRVRRGWQVLVAESLGPQRVQIPNALGETQRAAEINIRRRGLDISAVAEIATGAPSDKVLAQSPSPNSSDIAAPKISLLISIDPPAQSFVMPNFIGEPLVKATSELNDAGLHVGKITTIASPSNNSADANSSNALPAASAIPSAAATAIVSQDPVSGHKVSEGSAVNFTVH